MCVCVGGGGGGGGGGKMVGRFVNSKPMNFYNRPVFNKSPTFLLNIFLNYCFA